MFIKSLMKTEEGVLLPKIYIKNKRNTLKAFSKLTSGVSKQARLREWVRGGGPHAAGQAVDLYGSARADEGLLQDLLLVAVLAEALLTLATLQDDVDVAGDQGRDLLT